MGTVPGPGRLCQRLPCPFGSEIGDIGGRLGREDTPQPRLPEREALALLGLVAVLVVDLMQPGAGVGDHELPHQVLHG